MDIIVRFLQESINLWLEISPYLLIGVIAAGLLHLFLGKQFISRHLGKGGITSVIKATILGIPLPVCSCGVIPLASSLRKDGAHKSSVLSFLVSTPTTGVDSFFATYSLLGLLFAVFRSIAAFFSGIVVGIFEYIIEGKKERTRDIPSHSHTKTATSHKLREFFTYSFVEIPQDIGKWLIFGTLVGGFISAVIPDDFLASHLVFPFDFLSALIVGVPLYVCATGSIPIAVSLIQKGFSPGAGLVFLIVGPATNAITLSFVRAKLGKKSFLIYLISIIVVGIILGLIFNHLWFAFGNNTNLLRAGGKMLPLAVKIPSAIVLLIIIMCSLYLKKKPRFTADMEILVSGIHCQHCKLTLEGRLKNIPGIIAVQVDVEKKLVDIKGKPNKEDVIRAIKEAGYEPQNLRCLFR